MRLRSCCSPCLPNTLLTVPISEIIQRRTLPSPASAPKSGMSVSLCVLSIQCPPSLYPLLSPRSCALLPSFALSPSRLLPPPRQLPFVLFFGASRLRQIGHGHQVDYRETAVSRLSG